MNGKLNEIIVKMSNFFMQIATQSSHAAINGVL